MEMNSAAPFASRMLDESHRLSFADLIWLRNQPVKAKLSKERARILSERIHRNQTEIQLRVGYVKNIAPNRKAI